MFVCKSGENRLFGFIKRHKKMVRYICIFFVVFLSMFYLGRNYFGRNNQSDFVSYLSTYIFGSLYAYSDFLDGFDMKKNKGV